ncbi:MAG: SLC13 family permease [Aquificae bacterium]|nr:SLC13 family permease [Aquificota bacterium]
MRRQAFKVIVALEALLIGATLFLPEELLKGVAPLGREKLLTLEILLLAVTLFVSELVRVDVVGLLMMVLLPLTGIVSPEVALSGLSSNAVVSIIAVIIIGAGLDRTGIMNALARYIVRLAGNSEVRITALISGTVALISSFMQNIGAAALFLPAVLRISRRLGIPPSRLLMPMGFSAILGGTITLVGSSPLILLNDLLEMYDLEPFGLFSVTPIGLSLVAAGILYFILLGRYLLPGSRGTENAGSLPPELAEKFGKDYGVFEVEGELGHFPTVATKGGTLLLVGRREEILRKAKEKGLEVREELRVFGEEFSPLMAGFAGAVLPSDSPLVGRKAGDLAREGIHPVAVRDGKEVKNLSGEETLREGQELLLFGRWEDLKEAAQKGLFVLTSSVRLEKIRPEKAKWALLWFGVALFLVLFLEVRLSVALLTGALGMILSGVLKVDEAYRAVDWMTVFLLAGLLPLGIAFQETGTAQLLAHSLVSSLGELSPLGFYLFVALLTSFFTLVVSNVGATVLLVPLAVDMAVEIKADPRMAALVVGVSASNTFVIPTHQVNALIMRPGGYRVADYVRVGGLMTILFILVLVGSLYLFYL